MYDLKEVDIFVRPEEFKKPSPDDLRLSIATYLRSSTDKTSTWAGDKLTVAIKFEIPPALSTLDKNQIIDFTSWYSRQAGWDEVVAMRPLNSNVITFTMVKKVKA